MENVDSPQPGKNSDSNARLSLTNNLIKINEDDKEVKPKKADKKEVKKQPA